MKLLALIAIILAAFAATISPAKAQPQWGCTFSGYIAGYYWTGNVSRSYHTSCPFAQRVMRASVAFIIRHGGQGNGDFYVRVFSPVTYRYYNMHCEADGNIRWPEGIPVDCRGGIGARVYFRAHLR